jgi:hypothetical protein
MMANHRKHSQPIQCFSSSRHEICCLPRYGIFLQHRPFQRRAGRQALRFIGKPCLEGAIIGANRRADDGRPRACCEKVESGFSQKSTR